MCVTDTEETQVVFWIEFDSIDKRVSWHKPTNLAKASQKLEIANQIELGKFPVDFVLVKPKIDSRAQPKKSKRVDDFNNKSISAAFHFESFSQLANSQKCFFSAKN